MEKTNRNSYTEVDGNLPTIDQTLQTTKLKSTIIHEGNGKKKSPKTAHYVDNEKFYRVLVGWIRDCTEAEANGINTPRIPEYIGECVLKICEKLSTHPSFVRNYNREEMVLGAIENCLVKLRKFNPEKTANPFAYFTQIAYFHFIGFITEFEKEKYRRYTHILERMSSGEVAESPDYQSEISEHIFDNIELQVDHLQAFVDDYERRQAKKKEKQGEPTMSDLFDATGPVESPE